MSKRVEILLVDDNPADLYLTSDALSRIRFPTHVSTVCDGVEAIAYLRRAAPYQSAVSPDLVILDLNLPRKDGRAVLSEVKSDPRLNHTPIIILSTSEAKRDVTRCYELGANSYVQKPGKLDDFIIAIAGLGEFWFGCARLPSRLEE